ncbi:protein kinase domain-containing protein [Desulforhabdus amnigena]|jgi:serine/threonine-protein kinase|uniref:Serine/threonine protein kinase n=1 Tax=Desulforhabdus amnigena TaxID=40218 RepID=A0A9W6FVL2_9BACT|nr:protein kinase [Desulforhabdus amnigena]NLJ28204.1 protein kinase [Deltaproteobacteria bacterium]GLI35711.1 serine/threonine protein kinase [Desulforhabdus amnigena]
MKTVGKYEVCGLLGRGGMGVVYKARLPVVNKMVALKLLAPHPHLLHSLGREEVERRFIAEAVAMAALRHPHLLKVLDFDYDEGSPFFTMEYYYQNLGMLIGESARVEEPTRMLSLDKAIRYTRQILLGLGRMHRAGMVHRDVKPYNLFITDEDQVKIGDFGLSKLRGEDFRNPPNVMVGSPYYAAPEQERDPETVDGRADLYGVGVVFYRMLTGRLPEAEMLPPSECHPDVDPSWDDFVWKAIAPLRENRFNRAEEMLGRLDVLSKAWEEKKRDICRSFPERSTQVIEPKQEMIASLRAAPAKVGPREAPEIFRCDSLYRPLHSLANDFEILENKGIVLDRATNLFWQKGGSPDPLEWENAHDYVRNLNEEHFGGCSTWRLPTVNELLSLIKPVAHGEDDCMEPVFDRSKKWLWSCDRRSFTAAWYVDGELGFAGWGDFTCQYYVRAVCLRQG